MLCHSLVLGKHSVENSVIVLVGHGHQCSLRRGVQHPAGAPADRFSHIKVQRWVPFKYCLAAG